MSDESFITTRIIEPEILVIQLHGHLDAARSQTFQKLVQENIDAGHRRFIIDCAHLGFMSSLGIGALMTLEARLRRKGGLVKLAAVQGPVADVLSLVRLDRILGVYSDVEYAREAFVEELGDQGDASPTT